MRTITLHARVAQLSALLLALNGCEGGAIRGIVVDPLRQPLADVSVKITNTGFVATSSDNGTYTLKYAPGQFSVTWAKPGYTSANLSLQVTERMQFPADTVILWPAPTQDGLHLLGASSLTPLVRSAIRGTESPSGESTVFTVDSSAAPVSGGPRLAAEARFVRLRPSELIHVLEDIT